MVNAAKIMYIIGKIKNIIELVGIAFLLVSGVVMTINPSLFLDLDPKSLPDVASIVACGIAFIVLGVIVLAVCILELVFASKAMAALKSGSKNTMPHIVMIVFGVLGTDIFYLLGGIFGLVATKDASKPASAE